jgi:hypothetical protein
MGVVVDSPRMVFIEICSVMVETTCETTTTGMLSMLSYSSVTGRDVTTMLAGFRVSGGHLIVPKEIHEDVSMQGSN